MLGNKICVTQKGLGFLVDNKDQIQHESRLQKKHKHSRTSSLPSISIYNGNKFQTISHKIVQNDYLSTLSRKLDQLQKTGVRSLIIKKQDKNLTELLKQQLYGKQKYLNQLIPSIVKKTRDPKKIDNIDSRFHRSRAYTQRLLQSFQLQKKFGPKNNKNNLKRKNNEEQSS